MGGVAVLATGGCARTDLDTSSNHRSASDGVRLWETLGAAASGAIAAGVGLGQSPPRGQRKKKRKKKPFLMDLSKLSDYRYPYRQVQLKGQNKRTSSNKNYS